MKRELVTTLLTLSLLASSLPVNALAAEHAAPVLQQTQEASGSGDGESLPGEDADGEEALSGVFAFGGDTYDTMAEAFEAAASGGTVTLTGAYGGEGEPFAKIPAGVVLTIAGTGSLVLREEDAAAALQSQGTLRVEAGGSLEFLGQTYIGGADSVLHLTAGAVTIGDFRPADGKFRITLAENAAAEIPARQELKLTLPLETGSGLDLTVSAGASLMVRGALAGTGSQNDGGTDKPSAIHVAGALTVAESGQLRMSYGSSMTVAGSGTLTLNRNGVLDNDPAGPKPYDNTAKRFTYEQGAAVVVPEDCAWDLTRYTESTMTSYKDPVSGQTIYGNNGSAAVPEGGFQAAIGSTQYPTLAAAVSAAQPGAVIRLLQSVELDASGLANNQGALTLDKDLILEGGGFTISAKADTFSVTGDNGGGPSLVNIVNSADVTLRNVNFDGAKAAKHGLNIIGAGTVSLEDVEIAGCRWYAAVVSDADLRADGLTTSGSQWGLNIDKTASAVLADATIAEEDSVVFEGKDTSSSLTVESGSFQTIKTQGDATLGTVRIEGGTVEQISNGSPAAVTVTEGTVGSISNSGSGTASITGGTVTGEVSNGGAGSVTISGGTIHGAVSNTGAGSVAVTGGSFITADVGEFVDPDQTVILTLDPNGGSCQVKTLAAASGTAVGELPSAEREEHVFGGWYTAVDGGEKVTAGSVFDADATLYARWEKDSDSDDVPGGGETPDDGEDSSGDSDSDVSGEYLITVDRAVGGTVRVNPGRADKGETVTITVSPKTGYVLKELTVTDGKGGEISVKNAGENRYTFEMPGSKARVSARFSRTDDGADMPFRDVASGAYYFDAVAWAAEEGITAGVTGTSFAPDRGCTRAQIVTFLWRANGSPKASDRENPFTDVKRGSYYYEAVLWALEEGITDGVTGTSFAPDAVCTRAQAAVLLWRAQGSPKAEKDHGFRDVADGAYYADAVAWAAANGVTEGTTAVTFAPDVRCTRAQIVTFLYRALG